MPRRYVKTLFGKVLFIGWPKIGKVFGLIDWLLLPNKSLMVAQYC